MQKKSMAEIILAVLVGLLFISSYSAIGSLSGGNGNSKGSTATTTIPQTVYSYGFANAMILNYTPSLVVNVSCGKNTSSVLTYIDNIVSGLQNNNSVANSYEVGSKILVLSGNMNSRAFYRYVNSALNASSAACTGFQGTVQVSLPAAINFTVSGQQTTRKFLEPLNATQRIVSMPLGLGYNGNTVYVKVLGLLRTDGSIYQLNVSVVA